MRVSELVNASLTCPICGCDLLRKVTIEKVVTDQGLIGIEIRCQICGILIVTLAATIEQCVEKARALVRSDKDKIPTQLLRSISFVLGILESAVPLMEVSDGEEDLVRKNFHYLRKCVIDNSDDGGEDE